MNSADLISGVKKHFESLSAANGSILGSIKEIAPGIVVAEDKMDHTFIYYFSEKSVLFRQDRIAQLWGVNDHRGYPEGCPDEIVMLACGIHHPFSWNDVIVEAAKRLTSVNGRDIAWYAEPQGIT